MSDVCLASLMSYLVYLASFFSLILIVYLIWVIYIILLHFLFLYMYTLFQSPSLRQNQCNILQLFCLTMAVLINLVFSTAARWFVYIYVVFTRLLQSSFYDRTYWVQLNTSGAETLPEIAVLLLQASCVEYCFCCFLLFLVGAQEIDSQGGLTNHEVDNWCSPVFLWFDYWGAVAFISCIKCWAW